MFIGREAELAALSADFSSSDKTAVLVYGKRRVGKSTLIGQASRGFAGITVYHTCARTTLQGGIQLMCRSVSQALGLPDFMVSTIPDLFQLLRARAEQILFVVDEYQYLKEAGAKGEVDSLMQIVIDNLPPNVKLVLCGSYVTVMRELLDEDNPLFGRFTRTIFLKEMDYLDAARFYPHLSVCDRIAFYAVFGGSPYVLKQVCRYNSLETCVKELLLPPESVLRTHVEHIMLAEVRKSFDVRILQAIGNGRKRYSQIAQVLGDDGNGLLSKQLVALIDMETISKSTPINRADNRRKTFYQIQDNLMRFYFTYLFASGARIARIGEAAFWESEVGQTLTEFISLRFEEVAAQYFGRRARQGSIPGVQDIGSYWYDDPARHANGQFDCVVKRDAGLDVYEVKYYTAPMMLDECQEEERQVRRAPGLEGAGIGFVCSAGFGFTSDDYELVSGEDLYDTSLLPTTTDQF